MDYSVLLDAPGSPTRRIQIARLGKVKDPRYGEFEITPENVANWQKNLSRLPGARALIDFEHRSERKPRDSEAAGWITGVDLDGDKVMADAEWTDKGESAIRSKRYLFLSPAYGRYADEQGNEYDDTLCSTALTNKPVLGSLPMLTLASEERVSEAAGEQLTQLLDALDEQLIEQLEIGAGQLTLLEAITAKATNDLPDSAFAYIEPGGAKDADGKTVPRSKRHFPVHDDAHIRNALARAPQSPFGEKALPKIRAAAKKAGIGEPAKSLDSPPPMETEVLKTLELPDDTDLAGVLAKIRELQAPSVPAPVAELVKTLELPADVSKDDALKAIREALKPPTPEGERKELDAELAGRGLVALDAAELSQLRQNASAGAQAMKQLHADRFANAFTAAVKARKAAPAEETDLRHFYELDADATLKLLDAREPILPEKPVGRATLELDDQASPEQVAAAGLHPDSHGLDQQIRKYMLENKLPDTDYVKIFEQVQSGAVRL